MGTLRIDGAVYTAGLLGNLTKQTPLFLLSATLDLITKITKI